MKYTFSFFILSPKKRPSCCIKACEAKTCGETKKMKFMRPPIRIPGDR